MVSSTRETLFLVVSTTHATTYHYIETLQIAFIVTDNNDADIISVEINGVVTWNGYRDLELAW